MCQKEEETKYLQQLFILDGAKNSNVLLFSTLILIKPYEKTAGSLMTDASNPGRDRLWNYEELGLLSTFC